MGKDLGISAIAIPLIALLFNVPTSLKDVDSVEKSKNTRNDRGTSVEITLGGYLVTCKVAEILLDPSTSRNEIDDSVLRDTVA